MSVQRTLGLAAAFALYGFSGAGIYWNFLSWFPSHEFAGTAGIVIPFVLIWLLWQATKSGNLD
jgi:hypothetical protein